ncbi:unnamed protein product [Parnassius apollo]|uniref:DNA polymerase eta n=1 Tax=Parnassius apollo TaxID=110799 RepID=A0A8S3X9P7_PARAO|nr:unnamed protein product [Parnassius apollo]
MDQENRIVVLIDMDCFYCQVEEKLDPVLKGKPIAVVQYNPWKGGGIIAVNYVARAMGVTRHMRGDEAKEKCPEIQLPSVPCLRGKADITKYRDAGKEVAKVLQRFTPLLERASIDEAYLDITIPVQQRLKTLNVNTITIDVLPNTFALGYNSIDEFVADVQNDGSDNIDFEYEHARQLLVGAVLVSEMRAAVYNETGYQCSAGIAHNKILAKLVCGMNKPNKQTLLPKHCVNVLYQSLSVKKVKHLGGKFGDSVCETLKISKMGELQKFTEKELQTKFDEKNGTWLYNIARGIDLEPVQARFNPKSIGCCKQFRGKTALVDLESLKKWLKDLGDEIEERLENDALENNRTPRQMVVSFSTQQPNGRDVSSSRSYNFTSEDDLCGELFSKKALEMLLDSAEGVKPKEGEGNRHLRAPIKFLGISVGKFEEHSENKKTRKINDYFFGASCSRDVSSDKVITKSIKNNDKTEDKNEGKAHLFRKFFQSDIPDKLQSREVNEKAETRLNGENMLESSLDKQESFFAKFLKSEIGKNASDTQSEPVKIKEESKRPTTPDCNIVNIGEASNDTEYSGSTIDMEINKSISLFEEDPVDIDRVGNMRQLLNKSKLLEEDLEETEREELQVESKILDVQENVQVQVSGTFKCPECGKTVSVNMFDTHADYHFALKLREEEREIRLKEVVDKNKDKEMNGNQEPKPSKTRQEEAVAKNDGASIANYFMKIDGSVPTETCSECGKRVPLEKFGEHLDFHEAQKLSRELNNRPIHGNSVKRKRKSASPVKKSKVPCKSIDLFFR